MYRLDDFTKNESHDFNDLTDAEDMAIEIMDSLGFRWCRSEYGGDDQFEYSKYPAVGTCLVYVRITRANNADHCQ